MSRVGGPSDTHAKRAGDREAQASPQFRGGTETERTSTVALLALAGFVAFLWLVHAAMARIERVHPPKRARHSRVGAKRSPSARPDR